MAEQDKEVKKNKHGVPVGVPLSYEEVRKMQQSLAKGKDKAE